MARIPMVRLQAVRGSGHVQQVVAGFQLLARTGEIDLQLELLPPSEPLTMLVRAEVDGRRLTFDLQDGVLHPDSELNVSLFRDADLLFLRSYLPGAYGEWEEKARPLGLNYYVTAGGLTSFRAAHGTLRDSVKQIVGERIGRSVSLNYTLLDEIAESRQEGRSILFLTRVWGPEHADELRELNLGRVATLRSLRERFGDRLIGGLTPTPYAREHFAQWCADPSLTYRRSFFEQLRSASVCVTTVGLGGSNGWKLAEYVATGQSIVTEPICYPVTGDFSAGTHYLTFESPDEAGDAVDRLVADPALRAQMGRDNREYYRRHVRPDGLIRTVLAEVAQRFPDRR